MRRIGTNPDIRVMSVESEPRPARRNTPRTMRTRASARTGAFGVPGALRPRLSVHPAHSRYGDKPPWYLPLALAVDALGVGLPVLLVLGHSGQPHPLACALVAAGAWTAVRSVRGRYASHVLGEGGGVLGVLGDWLVLLGVLAVLRTAFGEIARPVLALLALTAAPLLTLAGRKGTHHHLIAARKAARSVSRVLVIGEPGTADHVVEHLAARTEHAYVVVGVVPVGNARLQCGTPVPARLAPVAPAGLVEDAAAVMGAARELKAELVLVAPGPRLGAERLRRLSWALHDAGVPLAVLTGLVDVAVRRVQLDAPAGLTMLHIAPPMRRGLQVGLKSALDRACAGLGLLLLAPLFGIVAVAIKSTTPGPVFHRQTRFGQGCTPFTMWKFRTMVVDAEARRAEMEVNGANENDGLMFKMRRDPRVTPVGRLLRRCSLDELPQLFNVLRGEMSLVGPRPPLPDEVARYDEVELRRLAVKPGITGLWQVSGRSDLSWDETVALDLRYVDNWSLTGDVDVMARTVRAVVDGRGAY
ncbi:exopolysaccharide biosynthesis polyprenyl glycosylphosphotransferase [Actinacidiphila rubida]|uniref:Exopolysaccharide biosynthesis polyprenyl glycosylphosphotransferase n=2 Tax=Actinacidiphila rubida TaxID=310780 RepID=A0A1H8N6P7_9ACTN|nr:exopolysaccharide biosynthesis polyprenyl glycosylphosphotransferase [Actinacidiphila rubida]